MTFLAIPLVYAALLWARLSHHSQKQWRLCALEATVLLGTGTIAITELLGFFQRLKPAWVSMAWALAGSVALIYLVRKICRSRLTINRLVLRCRRLRTVGLRPRWHPLETGVLVLALGLSGLVAYLSPANNYDSMTYHLARVMHWFQQGSLEHYPTSNLRQIAYGPGAAYWQIQLMALFNGDRAANLPQWFALVGSTIALSLWLRRFFSRSATGFAVLVGVTMPMALLQACSTQVDLQVGYWLLAAAVFLSSPPKAIWSHARFAGLAIGLAVVTKPSVLLCVAPLAMAAMAYHVRRSRFSTAFVLASVWVALAIAVCLPHFIRNTRWFGNPVGSDVGTMVETISPGIVITNPTRWLALNIPSMNAWLVLAKFLDLCGLDANDPAISFDQSKFTPVQPNIVYRLLLPDEDCTAYTFPVTLITLLGFLMLIRRAFRPTPPPELLSWQRILPWLLALMGSLALQVILLKWQFWGNRLLLPWALLSLPFLATLTGAWRHRGLRLFSACWLLGQTGFVLVCSLNRPLVPIPAEWRFVETQPLFSAKREEHFYNGYNAEVVPMARQLLAAAARNPQLRVGLALDGNYAEYVLWRAVQDSGYQHVTFYHVNPVPRAKPYADWPPPVDFTIHSHPRP